MIPLQTRGYTFPPSSAVKLPKFEPTTRPILRPVVVPACVTLELQRQWLLEATYRYVNLLDTRIRNYVHAGGLPRAS
jgi:hypothetical protein